VRRNASNCESFADLVPYTTANRIGFLVNVLVVVQILVGALVTALGAALNIKKVRICVSSSFLD